jgi:hypothetical protein
MTNISPKEQQAFVNYKTANSIEQHRNVCTSPSSSKITPVNTDIEAFAAKSESNRSTNSWERRASESGRPSQSREKRTVVNPDKQRPQEECDFCGKFMTYSNLFSTPAYPNARLDSSMSPSTSNRIKTMKTTPYSEATGCLTYAAVCTCPDIAFAVPKFMVFSSPERVAPPSSATQIPIMPVTKKLVALHLVSFFFTLAVPYRGAVPDNHAPLFPPQRRNTLQLATPPKKPYGSNVPSYKSVIFSQVPSVFCVTIRARSVRYTIPLITNAQNT